MSSHKTSNLFIPTAARDTSVKNYVDVNKVSKDLTHSIGSDLLCTSRRSDLSGSKGFNILLSTFPNHIQCRLNLPITVHTADGFLCRQSGYDVTRFGKYSTDSRIHAYQDSVMINNYIANSHDQTSLQDAMKNYIGTDLSLAAR
jgi:hypothetical protein